MYFDSASKTDEKGRPTSGVGIIFITPEGHLLPHSFALLEPCSNNVAEYQALIMGMELARELAIRRLEVRGDSLLIVNQMNNVYEVRKPDLHRREKSLAHAFTYLNIEHVPRGKNARADALAWLAASMTPSDGEPINITQS